MDALLSFIFPEASTLTLPIWLDLMAVMVGSLSGALTACERKLDLVGAVGLSMICGLGGGLIRDTIMQSGGVYMISSAYAIPSSVATGIVVFFFHGGFGRLDRLIEWVDIVGVGLFAAAGTDKAAVFGLLFMACLLMGTVTGIGGGMLRDVFLGDVPRIFRRGNLYALCAIAGAGTYYLAAIPAHLNKTIAVALCVVVTVGLRRWSLRYNILSPADIDLTPKVVEPVRRGVERARAKQESRATTHRTVSHHSTRLVVDEHETHHDGAARATTSAHEDTGAKKAPSPTREDGAPEKRS